MKKILIALLITLLYMVVYSEEESEYKEYTPEEVGNICCQWVFVAMEYNDLDLAKRQYYAQCNSPRYRGIEGFTWLSYGVYKGKLDQVKWALSLPGANVNDKIRGVTLLHRIVLNMHNNNANNTSDERYTILKLLLDRGADPNIHNDSEGNPPYSNGESVIELIEYLQIENSAAGQLVLQYVNRTSLGKGASNLGK
jgi:hypothetical protein